MSETDGSWLNNIKGLTTADGLRYTGSEKAYLKFLGTFAGTLEDKAAEIETSYNNGDMELCTIKVHALKSTARIIGARELSSLAEKMEVAGQHGDREFFDAHIAELLDMYRSYSDYLSELPDEENAAPREPISKEALEEAYEALRSFVPQMDYDAVKMILDEVGMYSLSEGDREIFEALGRKILTFDWEGMENLLQ